MSRVHGLRAELAQHVKDELGEAGATQRVVSGPRKVDVGSEDLVQVALASLDLGTGDEALHPSATFEVWVVVPGEGDSGEDRLEKLVDQVLAALESHDAARWISLRRTSYPPGEGAAPAFAITVTQEV